MYVAKTWVTIVPGSPYMGSTAINARQRPLIRIVGLRNIQCPLYWVAATNPMQIITVLLKE